MKSLFFFIAFLCVALLPVQAATITTGTLNTSVDVILDIVFAIDTSGSMSDEASSISTAMAGVVNGLSLPGETLYVRSRMIGIYGTWSGTNFNENSTTVLGAGITNQVEDNGPIVNDIINNYAWINRASYPESRYYRAVVTIGDEGLQQGAPTDAADWAAGYSANQLAKANNVMVFSLLGNSPSAGAADVFRALAIGGTGYGYTLQNTGGTFTQTSSSTLQTDIRNALMIAAQGGILSANSPAFGNVRVGTTGSATLTVTNSAIATANVTGTIGLAVPANGSTEFSPTTGSAQSFTVVPGASASRTYTYTPTARGADSMAVTVNSDVSTINKTITGTGVSPIYSSSVAPGTKISFASQFTNSNQTLTIQNITTDADLGDLTKLTIKSATISGANPEYFSLSGFTPGTTLTPNALTNLILTANSSLGGVGTKNATLTIVTDQNAAFGGTGSTFTYNLEIPATASGFTVNNINFGNVRIGMEHTGTLTITNTGGWGSTPVSGTITASTGDLTLTSGNSSFTNLAAGGSISNTYTYTPTAGNDPMTISVNTNLGTKTATVSATRVSPVFSSSVAPNSLIDFARVEPYSYGEYVLRIQNLTPEDYGNLTNMTLLSAVITGADASYFTLENFTANTVLGKNGYLDLVIRATNPEWRWIVRNATLTIVTDVNAAFGIAGNVYTYNLTAEMLPEPSTYLFMSIAGLFFAFYYKRSNTS